MKTIEQHGRRVAVISSQTPVMTDAASALQLIMDARYGADTSLIVMDKRAITEDFFILSRGLAGEILQKFVNYHIKLAIFGDFSSYTSKPLRDFIYESNKGSSVFFTATEEEAVEKLLAAP